MHNIIKSLNYQTKRDNFLYYAIFAAAATACMAFAFETNFSKYTGGYYFGYLGGNFYMVVSFIAILLSTRICGWDYSDKTLNYEILAGHTRNDVYWSRVIVCLAWSMALSVAAMLLPIVICTIVNGWGNEMDFGGGVLRFLMLLFPTFRIICEAMMFTFLTKSCFIGMALSFIYMETSSMIVSMLEGFDVCDLSWQLSTSIFFDLTYFNSKMGYIDGKDIEVFITEMEPSLVISSVVGSLGFGIAFIILGYFVFKKSDMR